MSDITIRNTTLADAPRILEIYAYYVEHTVITFEYDVPSLVEFEDRMRAIMQKYPYLVIERDGRIEGYAYAHAFVGRAAYDWAAELTIYLDHAARRGPQPLRLHRLPTGGGRIPHQKQRPVPRTSGLHAGRYLPQLRL